MFSVITNVYSKKTKGPTLMVLSTATGKLKKVHTRVNMLTRVWQELEYRIDVCRVTRDEHIDTSLVIKKKKLFQFSCGFEQFH